MSPRKPFSSQTNRLGVASRPGSMYQAGLLTFSSSPLFRLPISLETVAGLRPEKGLPDYSGGTVADSHRLPYYARITDT